MNSRQQRIMHQVIHLHQITAEPVGSLALSECGKFRVSGATLRNELAELEEEGYLSKPHTSAGRVPTLKSYSLYIDTVKNGKSLTKEEQQKFDALRTVNRDEFRYCRELAKLVADLSGEGVFVAFGPYSTYYTGLTNLFTKPELHEAERTVVLGQALDKLNEILEGLMRKIPLHPPFTKGEIEGLNDVEIIMGEDSPFGKDFGALVVRFSRGEIKNGIIGILGLLRMDWEKNMGMMEYVREIINSN